MEYPIRKEEKEIGGKNGLKEARSSAFKWQRSGDLQFNTVYQWPAEWQALGTEK